jgi:predicted dehydrogenase
LLKKPYTVGILGAGQIAQGYDEPTDSRVLTIAHAIQRTPGLALGGFFDLDPRKSEAAEQKWSCPASPRDRAAWFTEPWDIVYIATPDAQHANDLREAFRHPLRAILVEKPVALPGDEGLLLLEEAQRRGVAVLVNFPRRWHSRIAELKERIAQKELGQPEEAVFICSGPFYHNGVHMLDLFQTCWGTDWEVHLRSKIGSVSTFELTRGEKTVRAVVVETPASRYYLWEMHVYCSKGKVELAHNPEIMTVSTVEKHPFYSDFNVLIPAEKYLMDDEPLLSRWMTTVTVLLEDPKEKSRSLEHEIAAERFRNKILIPLELKHQRNEPCPH